MNLIDFRIFDVHLTTALTYLLISCLTIYTGRKKQFNLELLFIYVIGILISSVVSFEIIWLSLNSYLLHFPRTIGLSSIFINLFIIIFCLKTVSFIWEESIFDRFFFLLFFITLSMWVAWIPSFTVDNTSRLFADPIKLFQTFTVSYPWLRQKTS